MRLKAPLTIYLPKHVPGTERRRARAEEDTCTEWQQLQCQSLEVASIMEPEGRGSGLVNVGPATGPEGGMGLAHTARRPQVLRPLCCLPGAGLAFPALAGLPRGQVPAVRPSLCVGISLGEQIRGLQAREAGGELFKPGLHGSELRLLFLFPPPVQILNKKACPAIRLIPL